MKRERKENEEKRKLNGDEKSHTQQVKCHHIAKAREFSLFFRFFSTFFFYIYKFNFGLHLFGGCTIE